MLKFEDEFGKQSLLVFVIDGERMLWKTNKQKESGAQGRGRAELASSQNWREGIWYL